jgi:hypothetical protein
MMANTDWATCLVQANLTVSNGNLFSFQIFPTDRRFSCYMATTVAEQRSRSGSIRRWETHPWA